MLVSIYLIKANTDNLNKCIKKKSTNDNDEYVENFEDFEYNSNNYYRYLIFYILSFIIFFIEFMFLFYTLNIAITCTKAGIERFIHVFFAIFFTIPYAMFSIITRDKECLNNTFNIETKTTSNF